MRAGKNIVFSLALLTSGLWACSVVESGELVECKICHKEIKNTVQTKSAPAWDAAKYSVHRSEAYCQPCGDQPVAFLVSAQCLRCGKVYAAELRTAARRTEPADQVVRDGYCSDSCRTLAALANAVDEGSEAVGSAVGRVAAGLARGILRHMP